MNDEAIRRFWAEYFPKSGGDREALQICGVICRLIREKTKIVISLTRGGKLPRVLDGYGIAKADFDEIEKRFSK
jgi:hypothetical protein